MRTGTRRRFVGACVAALLVASVAFLAASPATRSDLSRPTAASAPTTASAVDPTPAVVSTIGPRWRTGMTDGRRGPILELLALLAGLLALVGSSGTGWRVRSVTTAPARSAPLRTAGPARAPPRSARSL